MVAVREREYTVRDEPVASNDTCGAFAYPFNIIDRFRSACDWKCEAADVITQLANVIPDLCVTPGAIRTEVVVKQESVESKFIALAEQWQRDTAFLSSITDIAMHPAYQRIIGMGLVAVPLILRELSREPNHWFWALVSITGENPVHPDNAGNLREMTEDWLRLGRERGWLA